MLSTAPKALPTFADYLRVLRKQRSLSLGQLALKSGVSKATLSRWEAGVSQPRIGELSQVLDALSVFASDHARCLRLLDTPRAVLAVRASEPSLVHLSLGDLLYGLRKRAGKTQEEAARSTGVSRALYRQWEADQVQPPGQKLHAAAFALGATGEEVAALSSRSLSATPIANDREVLLAEYMALMPWYDDVTQASYNLHLFSLLGQFGRLVRQNKADVGDLALIVADMGDAALLWGEDEELQQGYYRRSVALASRAGEPLHFHMASPIAAIYDPKYNSSSRKNNLDEMLSWESRFKTNEGQAYFLSFVAKRIAAEAPEQALRLSDQYCTLVAGNPDEYPCRLRDKGNLLYQCGQVAESIEFIAALKPQDNYRAVLQQFEMARGLIAVGSPDEARACIDQGGHLMGNLPDVHLRSMREAIEQALI